MTRLKFLLLLLFISFSKNVWAQGYFYSFSQTNEPYVELTGATILSTELAQPSYNYALPAGFKLFDKPVGGNMEVGRAGWGITRTSEYFMAYDPFYTFKGAVPGNNCSISAKTEITLQDTIVKFQWKNINIPGHPATDSFNFQMWLYKKSQTMEFRYGPSYITPMNDSVQITTVLLSADFVRDYENHQITGSGTNVTDDHDSVALSLYNGVVPNGIVFRFAGFPLSINDGKTQTDVKIFPNPVKDVLHINTPTTTPYRIMDVTGRQMQKGIADKYTHINIAGLLPGLYLLEIGNELVRLYKE